MHRGDRFEESLSAVTASISVQRNAGRISVGVGDLSSSLLDLCAKTCTPSQP
jgi:hypothetical protein